MPVPRDDSLENQVQQLGRELLEQARADREGGLFTGRPQSAMLEALMADADLRVRLLRFVDVLPALGDDEELVRHLEEYLGDFSYPLDLPVLGDVSGIAHWGLRHARRGVAAHLLAAAVRLVAQRLAGRFIAGRQVDQVIARLHRLHDQNMSFSLDLLGEATVSETEAEAYAQQYLDLLEALAPRLASWPGVSPSQPIHGRSVPRLNLSVKVSSLYSQMDAVNPAGSAEAIKSRLRPILRAARRLGAFINLDMEQYDNKAITLRLFRELLMESEFRDWADAGIALQAYLRDTAEDLEELIAWAGTRGTPVTVRLVRGAYWDYETVIARQQSWDIPVWTRKADTDLCYEHCLNLLLHHHDHLGAAIATHNVRSLALGMALAQRLELEPGQYEFQMLYGMADPLKNALVRRGQPLRVYVPYGELIPGMAYLVRRLLENSSSQSFLRLCLSEDLPAEDVLAPPAPSTDQESDATDSAVEVPTGGAEHFTPEPAHRFTAEKERQAFAAALARVRGQLGGEHPLVIDGQTRTSQRCENSTDPAQPARVVGRVWQADVGWADEAVRVAERALPDWARRPAEQRVAMMRQAAALMRQRRDELAGWEIFEAGKTWREADADVVEAIDYLEYYSAQALRLSVEQRLDAAGETNRYFFEPRGVTAVIAPWNFPLAIVTGMTAAALVTGNTVVLKPAPQTPVVAAKLMEIFQAIGLPPGVLNYLPGPDEVGQALVRHPRVHLIAFTGSEAVGCQIYAEAAQVVRGQEHLKRVVAEMGGKNAILVDQDADVDEAVRGVVASAFGYAGQKCSAAARVIVVGDLYQPFLARLIEAARSLRLGPPDDPGTFLGPVIDIQAQQRILAAIEAGKPQARLVLQVDVSSLQPGCFIGPTIFADVPPDCPLAQEEIFGPVLAVMPAASFEQGLTLAANTRFALTGGVYSRSPSHLELARQAFRVGNLYLNRKITGALVGRQPFGGLKMSGVGSKAGGPDYLLQFLEPRTVTENTLRRGFAPDQDPDAPAGQGEP